MDNNIILKLFVKIGSMIILIILQIIAYKYAKASPPEVKTENIRDGLSIKINHGNKLVFYLNQYLIPIIIIIFSFCIFDIIYLLTDFKLNIFEKIISIIILLYIAFILYIRIFPKCPINKKTIIFGIILVFIVIILITIRLINKMEIG